MTVLVTPEGRVRSANRVFRLRAIGNIDSPVEGRDFARFLITDSLGMSASEREGLNGTPLRVLQIPFLDGEDAPMLVALLDEGAEHHPHAGDRRQRHRARPLADLPASRGHGAGRPRRPLSST